MYYCSAPSLHRGVGWVWVTVGEGTEDAKTAATHWLFRPSGQRRTYTVGGHIIISVRWLGFLCFLWVSGAYDTIQTARGLCLQDKWISQKALQLLGKTEANNITLIWKCVFIRRCFSCRHTPRSCMMEADESVHSSDVGDDWTARLCCFSTPEADSQSW